MSDVAAQVKEIFDLMPSQLNPEAAKGMDVAIQFNLTGEGGGHYFVEVKDGICKTGEGDHPAPRMTTTIKAADYVDMVAGRLNPTTAFMNGKLKIQGDMGLAMKMQTLFKRT
jgi:putative sterol carrier protein